MTDVWKTGTSGDFSIGSNWQSGVAPGVNDDAVISGSTGVTLAGSGASHSLTELNGSTLQLTGSLSLGTTLTLNGQSQLNLAGGTLTASSIAGDLSSSSFSQVQGYGTINANVSGNTSITAQGGILKINGNIGPSYYTSYVYNNATLELNGSDSDYVNFQGSNATLKLDAPTSFGAQVSGFAIGDKLDLSGVTATGVSYSGTTLTVNTTGQTLSFANFSGSLSGTNPTFTNITSGSQTDALITFATPSTTKTWMTGTSGDFSTGSNWQSGVAPGVNDDAVISGSTGVTLAGSGASHSLTELNGSTLQLTGSLSLGTTLTLNGQSQLNLAGGTLTASSIAGDLSSSSFSQVQGYGTINANVSGNTSITAQGGILKINGNIGPSYYTSYVYNNATLELNGSDSDYVNFQGSNATLKLDAPTSFGAQVSGFAIGDKLDLSGVTATGVSYSGTTLTVNTTGQTLSFANFSGSLSGTNPTFTNITSGSQTDALITFATPSTTKTWMTGTSGDFSTGSNWQSGVAPGVNDDAVISGSTGVTLAGSGASHSLTELNGSTLQLTGSLSLGTTLTLNGQSQLNLAGGTLTASSIAGDLSSSSFSQVQGYGTINANVSGNTSITAQGGILKINGNIGPSYYTSYVYNNATLELNGSDSDYVNFQGSNATLKLDAPTSFGAQVSGFAIGDKLDLSGVTATGVSYSGTTLTVNTTGQTLSFANFSGSLSGIGPSFTNVTSGSQTDALIKFGSPSGSISGAKAFQVTTSESVVKPFSRVTIGDINANAMETLTIAVDGTGGTLSGAGALANGVYTLMGTATAVTSALDAVSFTPTKGQPNTSSTSTFKLRDTSSADGTTVVDSTTTVVDVPVYVAPRIVQANDPPHSSVTPNDLTYSSTASGPSHTIDTLNFVASFPDLIQAFGTNQQAAQSWYNANEPTEKRVETFDGLDYVASYGDLTNAFASAGSLKAVQDAGASHFITNGAAEGRTTSFNGLDYIASYGDLRKAFGADNDAGAYHYIESGRAEGRTTSFDGLDYVASYGDLVKAFGANEQAGAAHFITSGANEGRTTTFNGLDYIASYGDLTKAFGANNDAGATHFIQSGSAEGRTTTFDGLDYVASYGDLIKAFGANEQAGAAHFITNGSNEGRTTTFDGLAYIANYGDLMNAFGANNDAGATHYIQSGAAEGRSTGFNVAAYEQAHPDLIGKFASNDAFLSAYINVYKATGTALT